jgi:hypothetical protein
MAEQRGCGQLRRIVNQGQQVKNIPVLRCNDACNGSPNPNLMNPKKLFSASLSIQESRASASGG